MPGIYEKFRDTVASDLAKKPSQTSDTLNFISSYNPASNGGVTIASMINQVGEEGDTIFSHALSFDDPLMIRCLLENGANPNQVIHIHGGGTQLPILFTVDQGRVDAAKLLLTGSGSSAKANINEKFADNSSLLTKSLFYMKTPGSYRYQDCSLQTFLINNGLALVTDNLITIANFKISNNPTVESLARMVVSKGKDENGASMTTKFNAAILACGNGSMALITADQQMKDAFIPLKILGETID